MVRDTEVAAVVMVLVLYSHRCSVRSLAGTIAVSQLVLAAVLAICYMAKCMWMLKALHPYMFDGHSKAMNLDLLLPTASTLIVPGCSQLCSYPKAV